MKVEIDQSGKLEQLDTDTIVAFSNDEKGVVYISEAHRLAWKTHRSKQKTGIKRITQEEILNLLK